MKKYIQGLTMLILSFLFCLPGQAQEDTLRIFVLAGQSNMLGWGIIDDASIPGTLEHTVENYSGGIYDSLTTDQGDFVVRDDVWISMNNASETIVQGALSINYGGYPGYIGPEYGFGFTMGDCFADDVLIIKTAWGGRSLAVDFRPPSSDGDTGEYYNLIIDLINTAIEEIPINFPQLAGQPYKIEGFGWHQGWNDGEQASYWEEYEQNLINLIQDIRVDLDRPNLPFVVANSGMGGFEPHFDLWVQDIQNYIAPAQQSATEYPPFEGTVALADTRPFWPEVADSPNDAVHHWHDNAWSYLNIGLEMGLKMIDLLDKEDVVSKTSQLSQNEFNIYPSPTTDYLNLIGFEDFSVATVFDLNGQIITSYQVINKQIDLRNLKAGVYFIQLLNHGVPVTQKIVKF